MLIDSHCHLDFPQFADDRSGVVARAVGAGVGGMITICTRIRRFADVLAVARSDGRIACTVGTHPHNAGEEADLSLEDLLQHADDPDVVGVGEAGLDYHYDHAPRDVQARVFRAHIEAARRTGLPLVIHARDADDDVSEILRDEAKNGAFPFVLHCFSSGPALARTGVKLGGYVSFSGIATFKRSTELRNLAAELPADRVLVETDAPYLAPVPHRGRTNEPAFVAHTAATIAEARGMPSADFAELSRENTLRLFGKLPRDFGLIATEAG